MLTLPTVIDLTDSGIPVFPQGPALDSLFHDPLTGAPNAVLLHARLEHSISRARRHKGCVGVIVLRLSGLAELEAGHGRTGSDAVLIETTRRLQRIIRLADTVARCNHHEFVITCEDMDIVSLEGVAKRILAAVDRPVVLDAGKIAVSATVGLCLITGKTDPYRAIEVARAAAGQGGGGEPVPAGGVPSTATNDGAEAVAP